MVQQSQPVVGEVFKFSAHSLLNDALYLPSSMLNATKVCPCKCGASGAGVAGWVAGVRSKIQQTCELRALGYELSHKLSKD